jgi:hypothetical protein
MDENHEVILNVSSLVCERIKKALADRSSLGTLDTIDTVGELGR